MSGTEALLQDPPCFARLSVARDYDRLKKPNKSDMWVISYTQLRTILHNCTRYVAQEFTT